MNHGSLFSGIGGFDLASKWVGWKNVFQVEKDEFCLKVLQKNFPEVKKYGDIKEFDGNPYRGTIDLISGGFPCQPFSINGKRKGKEDDRYLWPEMYRVISEIQPSWVVVENVRGFVNIDGGLVFEQTMSDLEDQGYQVEPFIIPACSIDTPHQRERLFIIAFNRQESRTIFPDSKSRGKRQIFKRNQKEAEKLLQNFDLCFKGANRRSGLPKPYIYRDDHGVSSRVDRNRSLGNAIVPGIAYRIFEVIEKVNDR